jgi:predicted dehydrogenase
MPDGEQKAKGDFLRELAAMKKLKVAVVGAGGIAEKHLEVLAHFQDVEVIALCNRGNPRALQLAHRFNVQGTYQDYRRMLDEVAMDAVLVLVSTTSIAEVASAFLERGIPTLLEKPPGLSLEETKRLCEIAETHGTINMVGLNRRFYSVMDSARRGIQQVGPLVSVVVEAPERLGEYTALGIHPPQVIERLLIANGIHCIDLLRFFGGEVDRVCAIAGKWFADQADSFMALLRFQGGATGVYIANWMSPGRWAVTLYGKGRRITIAPLERGIVSDTSGADCPIVPDERDIRFKPGLYAQNRYFLDCVQSGRPASYPAADLEDALKTMELVELIRAGFA